MKRRHAIKSLALTSAAAMLNLGTRLQAADQKLEASIADKIHHSACRWCYNDIPLEDLAKRGKEIGLQAIDLLSPEEWPVVQQYGLTCSMVFSQPKGYGITKGFNRLENHDDLVDHYLDLIPKAAKAGLKKIICFSGNRNGLDDELGIQICAVGLKQLMPLAEKYGITLCMELLNSKVDHHDYQCDHTPWGVELVKAIGSDSFKLLYDIYHMQIMEGDVIHTIRDFNPYIAHYHTGGVPGRNEIDESQELYYPAIMKAIVDTGYQGYVAQEFIPARPDKLDSLEKCVRICSIDQ
ncbi:MAG: TIM barrel protein [Lewinellaceae bacterium]|nr:TIM barrel protein [Lewinellaceae bacterium]